MISVREATLELLRHFQMTTIFGNPGSTEMPFFKDFPADFKYVLGLQEASVVSMAEGYAQATRRAALVNLHTAPGLGNAMGAVISAYHQKTPLVITAGQQVRAMFPLEPFLFAREATELPKPYVKWSFEPARAADVPSAIARAYYTAMQCPRGPVFVSIPMDDWDAEIAAAPLPREVSFDMAPDPAALRALAEKLIASRRPCLVMGADVDRDGAWESGIRLAERLKAAVVGAPLGGRVGFPEDHPLFQGYLPPATAPLAAKLAGHDLVVVVGAPVFSYYPYVPGSYLPEGTTLVQLTNDPNEAARAPVGASIVGSLRLGLEALLSSLPESSRPLPAPRPAAPKVSPSCPLSSGFVIQTLRTFLPPDAVLVEESPSSRPTLQAQFRVTRSGGFYTTGGGGLGFGLPAAVGVQLAEKSRRVVCLLGDGSSLYSIQALWSARQYELPVIFIILDNAQYTILKSFGSFIGTGDIPGLDLPGKDLTLVARGLGLSSERIEEPEALLPALERAWESKEPRLLSIAVQHDVPSLL